MEPHEYLAVIRKRWIIIVAIALLGAGTALAYSATLPTLYKSTSSVFVSSQRGETSSEILQGSNFTQAQVQSYAQLASLPQVLDPVIERLDLPLNAEQLSDSVTADIRLNTVIIDISVSNRSAQDAARIADAVTDSLSTVAEALSPQTDQGPAITMTTVAPARVPDSAFAPNTRLIVASGLLSGLIVAVGGALGGEVVNTRMRSRRDVEKTTDAPLLGLIARRARGQKALIMLAESRSRYAEDYRRVAANLDFADIDEPVRSVVVTSATEAEGKTTTSVNLALAMAERHKRVLLIDADLRRPSVATLCGIEGSVGLTSVLLGTATLDDAIRSWAGGIIDVLPSGVVPANPGQILGSESMAILMENLIDCYDFIIVDSPPLLPVIDAVTISKLVDGAVLVVRSSVTRGQQVVDALVTLQGVSTTVFGVILNSVPSRSTPAHYGHGSGVDVPVVRVDGPPLTIASSVESLFNKLDRDGGSMSGVGLTNNTEECSEVISLTMSPSEANDATEVEGTPPDVVDLQQGDAESSSVAPLEIASPEGADAAVLAVKPRNGDAARQKPETGSGDSTDDRDGHQEQDGAAPRPELEAAKKVVRVRALATAPGAPRKTPPRGNGLVGS